MIEKENQAYLALVTFFLTLELARSPDIGQSLLISECWGSGPPCAIATVCRPRVEFSLQAYKPFPIIHGGSLAFDASLLKEYLRATL